MNFNFQRIKNIFKIRFVKVKTLCIFALGFGKRQNLKKDIQFSDLKILDNE